MTKQTSGFGAVIVRRIADRGHEVASHGHGHQLLYTLTPGQFREDVRTAKAAIEDAAGVTVLGFRALVRLRWDEDLGHLPGEFGA